ncbi:hypothetical protein DL546_005979 [Coniochaeta pulveracea]|uniref:Uncharacterized protein n=1 Tax=Coniochaeta pulveracea TaxID=177199 RepID=A0A420YKV3_9PEZI|nr:hypothetical protein DL546_005979 [Coniochaeta pulveracea]
MNLIKYAGVALVAFSTAALAVDRATCEASCHADYDKYASYMGIWLEDCLKECDKKFPPK